MEAKEAKKLKQLTFISSPLLRLLPWLAVAAFISCAGPSPTVKGPFLETLPSTLLWIPRENRMDWNGFFKLMQDYPQFNVALALSLESIPESSRESLNQLQSQGRVEMVLRIPGDPVFPMVHDFQMALKSLPNNPPIPSLSFARPQDNLARTAIAKERYKKMWGSNPKGLLAPGGALLPENVSAFSSLGIRWMPIGGYAGKDFNPLEWPSIQKTVLIPYQNVSGKTFSDFLKSPAWVLDETMNRASNSGIQWLTAFLESKTIQKQMEWSLPSDLISQYEKSVNTNEALPLIPWSGTYAPWIAKKEQVAAWSLLSQAAQILDRYQNSGKANLKTLDPATQEIYTMESGQFFLGLGQPYSYETEEMEKDFRTSLVNIYRLCSEEVPSAAYRPLGEISIGNLEPSGSYSSRAVSVQSSNNLILITNPPEKKEPSPSSEESWYLSSLKLEWNAEKMRFSFEVPDVDNIQQAPYGFSHILLDVYIDLNHRVGSGSTELLQGRELFTEPKDAWEFALSISGWGARLFQASPTGATLLHSPIPYMDESRKHIFVDIPRNLISGNPKRWGYLSILMRMDPSSSAETIYKPVPDSQGKIILDSLSPADFSSAGKAFTAVRIPS